MCVVHVTYLESGTLTRQATRTQSRETTLVSDLSQRVGLIHELRERVGSEERVDDARDGLGVDQVGRGEHLIVADVHSLADGAAHTGQSDRELIAQLLAHGAHTTVRQVVDVVDGCIRVYQLNEIFDNLYNVFLGQNTNIHIGVQTKFLVDTVTTYITQVITLVGEEEVLNDLACTGIIGRIGIAQLTIDIEHSLLLGITGVFLQGVEDDGILVGCLCIFMKKNGRSATVEDILHIIGCNLGLTVHDDLVTLDGNHLTGVLINEVLIPALQHTGCQTLADSLLHVLLVHLHFLAKVEDLKNLLIALETDGAQQSGHGQLLLTVDVGIHHIIDVGGKLNP